VEDANEAIYVWANATIDLYPGDRVLIRGKAADSFRPIVISESITVLGHGALPKPLPATFDELIGAQRDCMLVTVHAVVLSADLSYSSAKTSSHLLLLANQGVIDAYINSDNANFLEGLLDAEVEVTGVASGRFDGKMQQTGTKLGVSSIADVMILKRAAASPWSLPITQMDEIISKFRLQNASQRVRVQGTITYFQPGSALVLQNGKKSLWIMTARQKPLLIGDRADVTGFPNVHDGFLALSEGEVQEIPANSPIAPQRVTRSELSSSKHIFDLVSIEGELVTEIRENSRDEYVLVSDGQVFSASYRHPLAGNYSLPPMNRVPLGARVRVSGIAVLDSPNPYTGDVAFDILMRTPDDIAVVARPTLLNVHNLAILVGLLLAVVFAIGSRGWIIERATRRQTAALAYIEKRRSRILENINGSRPLAEIIEEITELASFKLHGAPCWCQVADGALLGNCPAKLDGLRIVQLDIPSHAGPVPGTVFTAFDYLAKTSVNETETLSMAVGLAALAIETRRLYNDLVHRSEFDLLTDIHNRFSLETHLKHQILVARETAGIFGLIYIDLDQFKLVNDTYGHHVGDLYLQEAADRMKQQLRPHDKLARLGGDEFAALVPSVRSRAEVEEIARRLERCFDEPFVFEECTLGGAASVGIAVFPEDATTVDALLSAADATMYKAKRRRREMMAEHVGLGNA
jgi:diguanylate cyclase (GGDEF)-like protein